MRECKIANKYILRLLARGRPCVTYTSKTVSIVTTYNWSRHLTRARTVQKHPHSPIKKKFKSQPSAGKLLLAVFWDSQGPVLEHNQERGTTINSAGYKDMLIDCLKPAIRSKRRGLLSKDVVLLHDNTAAYTAEALWKHKFDVMAHPSYSPDLAPSEYYSERY
jgi:hypothetical protein